MSSNVDPSIDGNINPKAASPESRGLASKRRRWKIFLFLFLGFIAGCFAASFFLPSTPDALPIDMEIVSKVDPLGADANSDNDLANVDPANLRFPDRISQAMIDAAEHPYDPLIDIAETSLGKIDREIKDYTATLNSQVRLSEKLQPSRKLFVKIRHSNESPEDKSPFSVYTKFIEPKTIAGQEAIWVDGWHEGNLVAHVTGFGNLMRFYLEPTGRLAMADSLHPIYDIGFRNLLVKMIEVGRRDREYGECFVTIKKGLSLDGRDCTMLEVLHPVKRNHFESHIARIYIDDEMEIPLAYEGYLWPEEPEGEPVLLEKYVYTQLRFNVGLKDIDFDPANEEYDYPAR